MIRMKSVPDKESSIKAILNPLVKRWFESKFDGFALPQLYSVLEIHGRNNILVSAPTGSGKTLTGFLSILNELVDSSQKGILEDKVYAVYVSPLKALNRDISVNLKEPLEQINDLADKKLGIRVAVRTGDTTTKEKSDMLKKPPHILITTPESLAIILSSPKFREHMKDVSWCIIDEIHALAENKRGVHLSLSMERLQRLSPGMCRVGLSATVAPLEDVAHYLVGEGRHCKIVDVQFIKEMDLKVLSPVPDLINVTFDKMHHSMYQLMSDLIQSHKTTLIFTNTRSATERVVHYLKEKFPKLYDQNNLQAHHGSLSKEHRFETEEALRKGKLRSVVCSTSLELGIDIGFIDLVILLGSPKSIARALQRCLPYDTPILTSTGHYIPIGEIVEKRLGVEVMSYDSRKGFLPNKISKYHKNSGSSIINFKLRCGESLTTTANHPILTDGGWKNASDITKDDKIAEVNHKVRFRHKTPCLFELLPHDKVYVKNRDNFYQRIIDDFLKKNKLSLRVFAERFSMDYKRLVDCRRLKGRKKSVLLADFLKICRICKVPQRSYIEHLRFLKTKGWFRKELPIRITPELMWLAGIMATDGSIVKNSSRGGYYHIKIGNKSKELIDKCREIFNQFGFASHMYTRDSLLCLECGSALLTYLMLSLGLKYKNKTRSVEVGNAIFGMNTKLLHAYLEGVFEGDGNFNKMKTGVMVRIFTASRRFADQLHLILSRNGYHNNVSGNYAKGSKLIPNTNCFLYQVTITGQNNIKRLFENFPKFGDKAISSFHIMGRLNNTSFKLKQFDEHIHWEDITKITKGKTSKPVYNLTLEKEPNNFVAGNIIVHNCGRSGHRLHSKTKGRIIVLDRDDLVECSVLLKNAVERKIDRIHIPENCLDVLAQHVYGMAIDEVLEEKDAFKTITQSYCYRNLKRGDFDEVLSYLAGEYTTLEDRHVYAKIWRKEGKIGRKGKLARVLYMTNIGTIPDETGVKVKIGDKVIGQIAEGFLEKLKRGDIFVLGGNVYTFLFSRGMTAQVQASVGSPPTVPSWFSEMLPLSFDLALEIQRLRGLMEDKFNFGRSKKEILEFINSYLYVDANGANAIYEYFREQYDYSEIPFDKELLVEHYTDPERGDKKIVFHALFGRRVNDCLSRAVAFVISRTQHRDVEIGINDNGFYVSCNKPINVVKAMSLIKSKDIDKIMKLAIGQTEVLRRRFRHCAGRALMILRNYMGRKKNVGRQQVNSMLLISAVKRISDDFSILKEARREVLEDLMDIENTKKVIELIESGRIKIKEIHTNIPSPFAFNLIMQGYLDLMKMEDKQDFLRKMHMSILAKIALKKGKKGEDAKDILEKIDTKTDDFSYDKLWKEIEKKKEEDKNSELEDLKLEVWNLKEVPMFAREELISLLEGAKSIRHEVIKALHEHEEEIRKSWPEKLYKRVFELLKQVE